MVTQEIVDRIRDDYRTPKVIKVSRDFYKYMAWDFDRFEVKAVGNITERTFFVDYHKIPVEIDFTLQEGYKIEY